MTTSNPIREAAIQAVSDIYDGLPNGTPFEEVGVPLSDVLGLIEVVIRMHMDAVLECSVDREVIGALLNGDPRVIMDDVMATLYCRLGGAPRDCGEGDLSTRQ